MRPELFRVYEFGFPAYFVLLLTGFLFATAAGALWARRIGRNPDVIVDLGLTCLLAGVIGARLLHVFADGHFFEYVYLCTDPAKVTWHIPRTECVRIHDAGWLGGLGLDSTHAIGRWDDAEGVCHPIQASCFAWAEFYNGGLTYYGGLIVASLWAVYVLRRDRFPFWKAADMAGFAVPLGLGFGRMGCLLAGCCFGVESSSRLALSFPPHSPATEAQFRAGELSSLDQWSKPVLPTQIFESAMCLAIAAFCLLWAHGRKRYDGQVFASFLALYAVGRFILEFWRADDRGGLFALSTSQLIGIAIVGVAAAIHWMRRPRADAGDKLGSGATRA
jgi:phosphatidylglycerol:prolipoprotein diacylglycerol transferase